MNWTLFGIFVALNVVNVIIQTAKSIVTIKCGKTVAALVNALAYGLYTFVVVYMVCELNIWLKASVIAVANLIGVYAVKSIEEKTEKTKLWKIEATVNISYLEGLVSSLMAEQASFNYHTINENYVVFNIYCKTKDDSRTAKKLLDRSMAKYFVSESKIL